MEERKRLAARLRWRDELRAEAAEANKALRRKREEEDEAANRRTGAKKKKRKRKKKTQRATRTVVKEDRGEMGEGGSGGHDRGWSGLLESLDPDTGLCVLSFLDTEDLVRQRAVSRRWGDLASADCLWKPRFLRLYGPPFLNGIFIFIFIFIICFYHSFFSLHCGFQIATLMTWQASRSGRRGSAATRR
jgi:hypothetical protein